MYLLLREWLDRFIELMLPSSYFFDNGRLFLVARQMAAMVAFLGMANSIIVFQVINGWMDYSNLKTDYTSLHVAYLHNTDTIYGITQSVDKLQRTSFYLYTDNKALYGQVNKLLDENRDLSTRLGTCKK